MSDCDQKRRILRLEKIAAHRVQAVRQSRQVERLRRFWDALEAELQAEGNWRMPGHDFYSWVTQQLGVEADAAWQESGTDGLLLAILQRFPELEPVWRAAMATEEEILDRAA